MYNPAHFQVTEPAALHRIIQAHPLGMLVANLPGGMVANHVPFEFEAAPGNHGLLRAHLARANPLWEQCAEGAEVLVVFRGNESYISPNWYPSKHEHHRQVPTWNYEVVHVHGRLTVMDDERFLRGLLARLTRTHEAAEPRPWKMGDSAPEYIDAMLKAIVGVEVHIERIEGKSKMSQNREPRDVAGAVQALRLLEKHSIAQTMESPPQKRSSS